MDIKPTGVLPEALLVDLPEVDAQYEEIFARIELLKATCFESDTVPFEACEALLALLAHHFATEERIAACAELEFSKHTKTHRDTFQILSKALDEVHKGVRNVHSFLRYVEFWFERHITQDDKPFAASLPANLHLPSDPSRQATGHHQKAVGLTSPVGFEGGVAARV
jgi:hemerythrin